MAVFRVRARAVDMLGRQQIAGIPTAIHELFKNAHDAYAQRVEVDYFRRERLFVLRDDGVGMTRDDIEQKWLTLGTDSRVGANDPHSRVWTGPGNLPRRVIMGEKGIGRLAVAAIGPVTLLVSRAIRQDGARGIVTALIHWKLFEQPGIDVSSIVIPLRETGRSFPTKGLLDNMIDEIEGCVKRLGDQMDGPKMEALMADLNAMRLVDPQHLDHHLSQAAGARLSLANESFGTWFIITPTTPELDDDIDRFPDGMGTSNFNKVLLGFANVMDQDYAPVIQPMFRDHRPDGIHSLIGTREFFGADDFALLDHHIEGSFDDRGQFTGKIAFYGDSSRDFVHNWATGRGRQPRCGPFRIRLAVLQGRPTESRLDRVAHKAMLGRLNELGGLYIYRDGIRVLPYGTAENDFIGIELRRTLAAKDWYFSYRRMIGFVAVTHKDNPNLSEKAGREGFRENYAYRDLKSVLEEFVKAVAVRFFRLSSEEAAEYQDRKEWYVRDREALGRRTARVRERRVEFIAKLNAFRVAADGEYFERRAEEMSRRYLARLKMAEKSGESEDVGQDISAINAEFQRDIASLYRDIVIHRPRGLMLTKNLERDWSAYNRISAGLIDRTVGKLESEILEKIRAIASVHSSADRRREAALVALEARRAELYKEVSDVHKETLREADNMRGTLRSVFREELGELHDSFERTMNDYAISVAGKSDFFEHSWTAIERRLRFIADREVELIEGVRRQLKEFRATLVERTTVEDEVAALEESVERLKEQLEFQSDLAQVGMAVGILGHEFNHTVAEFRDAVHELKDWAEGTDELRPLYGRLRRAFEGLEGYLQMLAPLGRRLTRRSVDLSGSEISLYVRRIFSERLEESGVRIVTSAEFSSHVVRCRTASVLGAFVNIIDNALYWITQEVESGGEIRLGATEDSFIISNNGPGISEMDAARVFEFGWTSKPGGAGMGLALARDALRKEGFDLELREVGVARDPVFAIFSGADSEEVA